MTGATVGKQTLYAPGLPDVGWWLEDVHGAVVLPRASLGPNADNPPGFYRFSVPFPAGFQGYLLTDNGLSAEAAEYTSEDIDLTLFATRADVQAAGFSGAGNAQVSSPLPAQTDAGYSLTLKRGDTLPSVALHLLDGNGHPMILPPGTAVQFHMGSFGRVKVDAPAVLVDAPTALVQYAWQPGDTDTGGEYQAEFRVTFPGGGVETWPNQSSLLVHILNNVD